MKRRWYATPYALWMLIFTIVPLLFVVYFAFTTRDGAFTTENFGRFFSPGNLPVVFDSFRLAFFCTLICLLIGYPAAYFLSSRDFSRGRAILVLILLPMWMNFLLRTYAMMTLLERNGVINTVLDALGLPHQNLIGTEAAVLLGMVYNFLPFMVLPIYNVLCKIDDNTINAARDLGASFTQTLLWVWFPLSVPGIISGITMVFVPSLTTFVISNLLGGSKILLIGNVIEQEFTKGSNWNLGSGLSLVLMVFILISMALIAKYDKNGEGSTF